MESIILNSAIKKLSCEFDKRCFFVTDSNVFEKYSNIFAGVNHAVIVAGEQSKNMQTVLDICEKMLLARCNRDSIIVAVGGGVVGDVAGFCSAIFMRGIKWINVPTTLLAQVDSSIGGKTGVDFMGCKNILGAFNLPQKVIICNEFLATLSAREWICGMGEVIKTAMLDENIFAYLVDNFDALLTRDSSVVKKIVELCALYKEGVTTRDFKEGGERKNLNLGHTVAHALEGANNYSASHGEYVLWGIKAESFMFKNQIEPNFYRQINELISKTLYSSISFDTIAVSKKAMADKKNHDGSVSIIICLRAGKAVEKTLSEQVFTSEIARWRDSL